MDHVNFPYRSSSHLALMHVIAESGSWEKHGLEVDYDKPIDREAAHKQVISGEVEFVSGNHVSTYAARAHGDTWVYLGQTASINNIALVTRTDTGINKLEDVRKKKFGSRGRHPGLNTWLYLKQHGLDVDREDVEIVHEVRDGDPSTNKAKKSMLQMVKDGDCDAAFFTEPKIEFAKREGLKVISVEPQPMIFFMTVSSSMKLVEERPDLIDRMLKGIIEGTAFFKREKEKTIKILMDKHHKEGTLDRDAAEKLYKDLAPMLDERLYPSMPAIANVYQEALRQNKDSAKVDPLSLWDLHFLRRIDDSGFIDKLYGRTRGA
jgi:ABC-type nitrate/sulfonate/bicarbonate transport system substrate-binding protein